MTDAELRQRIREAGLGRVADALLSRTAPAIWLATQETEEAVIGLGETRMGGRPDLPDGVDWPSREGRPLSFLGQLNLADVFGMVAADVLPTRGFLYFFYDSEQQVWGFDPEDAGSWSVIYADTEEGELGRESWPEDMPEHGRFQACRVEARDTLTLPPWESDTIQRLELLEEEEDRYVDLLDDLAPEEPVHQLLGHPDPIQGDMALECQLVSNGIYCGDPSGYEDPRREELEAGVDDWRLLFQVESDENAAMMWGDAGRLYYWIRIEDLLKRDFSGVWMILQCH